MDAGMDLRVDREARPYCPPACGLCGNPRTPLRFDAQVGVFVGACPCTNRPAALGPYPVPGRRANGERGIHGPQVRSR